MAGRTPTEPNKQGVYGVLFDAHKVIVNLANPIGKLRLRETWAACLPLLCRRVAWMVAQSGFHCLSFGAA